MQKKPGGRASGVELGKDTRWLAHKSAANSYDTSSVYLSQGKSESQRTSAK
jgi:hypothetical protein